MAAPQLLWLSPERQAQLATTIQHSLPETYNFEIGKTLQRLHEAKAKRPCLQAPEGLMVWIESISHIIEEFGDGVESCVVFGDVTYGACCVDDIKAKHLLDRDFLVHYAHSCLVPLDTMEVRCLYIFVEINLDAVKLAKKLVTLLPSAVTDDSFPKLTDDCYGQRNIALMGTIQFSKCVHACAQLLRDKYLVGDNVFVPQQPPLSPGETLGCTSVVLPPDTHLCVFISDGRFHIEGAMIQNPHVRFYKYDPFLEILVAEYYDRNAMLKTRSRAIEDARSANLFVIVLSTLGRQGCTGIVDHLLGLIKTHRGPEVETCVLLLAELNPGVLARIGESAGPKCKLCIVNIGCPRLSIDWGADYPLNVVNSYELVQALKSQTKTLTQYPMDYFSRDGGEWSNGPHRRREHDVQTLREKWIMKKKELLAATRCDAVAPLKPST